MCSGEGKDHNQALHKEKGPSKTWKKSFQSSDYFLPHYNYGLVCPQNPLYGTLTGMYKTILCQKLIQLVLWSLWVLRKDSWPFQHSSGRLWWGPEVTSGNLVDTEGRNPTEYSIGLSENSSAKWRCKKTQGCSLTMNIVGLSAPVYAAEPKWEPIHGNFVSFPSPMLPILHGVPLALQDFTEFWLMKFPFRFWKVVE